MAGDRAPTMIGTAGWSIPAAHAAAFAPAPGTEPGSHLTRYAARLPAVEINSSFHRPHRPATYARWAASVPAGFRFSVKLPRAITHTARLLGTEALLDRFLAEAGALRSHQGPLLVQLPPSLDFDAAVASAFFAALRARFGGPVACEPRHATWFAPGPESLLVRFEVARVAADPAVVPEAARPGGWGGFTYHRLHGTPQVYRSAYAPALLEELARRIAARRAPAWCIFDNTAEGAATHDALTLLAKCGAPQPNGAAGT